jgi:hypothetical protein
VFDGHIQKLIHLRKYCLSINNLPSTFLNSFVFKHSVCKTKELSSLQI